MPKKAISKLEIKNNMPKKTISNLSVPKTFRNECPNCMEVTHSDGELYRYDEWTSNPCIDPMNCIKNLRYRIEKLEDKFDSLKITF